MTWVSSDEGIATVTGTTNRFTVKGRRWGRCKITGTATDGGFTVDIYVDVGFPSPRGGSKGCQHQKWEALPDAAQSFQHEHFAGSV